MVIFKLISVKQIGIPYVGLSRDRTIFRDVRTETDGRAGR